MAEETKPPETHGGGAEGKKKSGNTFQKHKWWFIGGGFVFLGILYFAIKKSNANANATSANPNPGVQGGIDPATGYLYGSPADLSALGQTGNSSEGGPVGAQGPAGPQGPPGPAGPSAPAGNTPTPPAKIGGANPPSSTKITKPVSISHPATNSSQNYTVKSGDSLWAIAAKFYGNGNQYTKIYNANKGIIGSNPSLIHPGQRLVIPK